MYMLPKEEHYLPLWGSSLPAPSLRSCATCPVRNGANCPPLSPSTRRSGPKKLCSLLSVRGFQPQEKIRCLPSERISTGFVTLQQRVTKRCRLSLLTNSALVYESQCGRMEGVAWSQPVSTTVHITWHGAQINFGDLPHYLTYALQSWNF